MTCRKFVQVAFLAVLSSASSLAMTVAQNAQKPAPKIEYYYEVVGASSLAPSVPRVWSEPYDSEAEATNRLNQILREHAPGGELATDPEKPIKLKVVKKPKAAKDAKDGKDSKEGKDQKNGKTSEDVKAAKSAVDKAKDLLEGKERQAGDTLKEYKERIQVAWDNVTKTKKALTQQTQAITAAQLKNVNDQISQYNSSRDQLSAKFAVESRPYLKQYSALPKVAANDFGKKKDPSSRKVPAVEIDSTTEDDPFIGKWVQKNVELPTKFDILPGGVGTWKMGGGGAFDIKWKREGQSLSITNKDGKWTKFEGLSEWQSYYRKQK